MQLFHAESVMNLTELFESNLTKLGREMHHTYDPEGRATWDRYFEQNEMRWNPNSPAVAFVAWMVEAAGDIWREITGETGFTMSGGQIISYLDEKVYRIKKKSKYDWDKDASQEDLARMKKLRDEIFQKLKPKTKEAQVTKYLLISILNRDYHAIQYYCNKLISLFNLPSS